MSKTTHPIAVAAASLATIAIITLFAIQMRYVAASMDLVTLPQASAAALDSPTDTFTAANGLVVAEYCSEAVAARDPKNPAGRTSTNLAFDDAWFSADAERYNHDLATSCAVLSAVCNSESRFYSSDGTEDPYAERALTALGFKHVRTESYALRSTIFDQVAALMNGTHDSAAYTFASKRLEPTGDTLVFVGVRGTYGAEWLSNFSILDGSGRPDHEGYRAAEREVANALATYLREIGADPARTRVVATGHSRGGAIANLLAAELVDRANGPDALTRVGGVYAYTFAAPCSTRAIARGDARYEGIFNIVNPSDIVPQLPLSAWGYGRYGTTVQLPSPGDARFTPCYAAMQRVYELNTGSSSSCSAEALASLNAFGSRAAGSLPTAESFLNPLGVAAAMQQLAAVDVELALQSHYPDTYIAWMQAVDISALSFSCQ